MNTLFLTLPVSHTKSSEKLGSHQLIEDYIEAIKQIAKYLKAINTEKLRMIISKLGIDKTIYKIIDDFSSDTRDPENDISLEKLERKLVLLKLLQGESKKMVNDNGQRQISEAKQKEYFEATRKQVIKQLNYRVLIDKHKEEKAMKKKQVLLKERVKNIRSHNSYKENITSKHKEREKEEIEKIVEGKKRQNPTDFSIWNRGSIQSKQRMAFTSIIKYRLKKSIRGSHNSETHKDELITKRKNNQGNCSGSSLLNRSRPNNFRFSNIKRKQVIDGQLENQQLSKAVQKLMKIEDIKERKKESKKIKKDGLEINRNNNTFDDTFEKQQKILTKLTQKSNNKQEILRQRSMKIHKQLELKKIRLDRLKANEQERYELIEKENLNLNYKSVSTKNQNDLSRQNYIRRRHHQAIERNKNKEQVINIVHSSNSQLYRYLLKDFAQNSD